MSYTQCHACTHTHAHMHAYTRMQWDRHRVFCWSSVASQGLLQVLWLPLGRGSACGTRDKREAVCVSQRREKVCGCMCARYLPLYSSLIFTHPFQRFKEETDQCSHEPTRCGCMQRASKWGNMWPWPRRKPDWHSQQSLKVTREPDSQSGPWLPGPSSKGPWQESLSRQILPYENHT